MYFETDQDFVNKCLHHNFDFKMKRNKKTLVTVFQNC